MYARCIYVCSCIFTLLGENADILLISWSHVYLLLVDRVKPQLVVSKLNPADLPPPKDHTEKMKDAEDESVVMSTAINRIASTPGGN